MAEKQRSFERRVKRLQTDMDAYIDASLAFMESREMRDYLREELPKSDWAAMACAEIVAYAPAPIEKKLPVLEQIAREPDPKTAYDGEPFTAWAARFVRSCRMALEERCSGPEGAMFRLESEDRDTDMFRNAFFTDFNAALRYLARKREESLEGYHLEEAGYTITKYAPDGKGQLKEICTWYLNHLGELWYFDYEISLKKLPRDWEPLLTFLGDLNLPVPFQPGDIVTVDCRPYVSPRRVLILEVGDNCDCCCLQVLFMREDGRLDTGAFKHNHFLCHGEISHISGLYRAARWTGEKAAPEEPFAVLSPRIHARPALGSEIWNYFFARSYKDLQGEKYTPTWQELKRCFRTGDPSEEGKSVDTAGEDMLYCR